LVADIENELRTLAAALTDPREGECLLCYVRRMLEFGCDRLRWARRYRDLRAPRAIALEERLGRSLALCDCSIFTYGFQPAPQYWVPGRQYVVDGVTPRTSPTYPNPFPACLGVRRGSTQGCGLWVPQRHRW
jgi:hypothetical protein